MNTFTFQNQDLEIFHKGNFEPINRQFIHEAKLATNPIMEIQQRYQKLDNDSFFNELKDGMIGAYLGYDLVNTHKHGLDAKKSANEEIYLEVKQVSVSAETWAATFNDTTLDKAQAFMDEKVYLAVGVWAGISDLQFIVYGQHPNIGHYLYRKVLDSKENSRRSTQTISVSKLVKDYGFKIYTPTKTRQELVSELKLRFKKSWWDGAFVDE